MTREDVKKIIMMLASVYPHNFTNKTQEALSEMIDVWHTLLDDLDANQVAIATREFLRTRNEERFMPTPAVIRNEVYELFKTEQGLTEQEAWGIMYKAICNSGYNSHAEYDKLPDVIKSLTTPQMLKEYSMMDADELNTVVSSNFMRSYKVRKEHHKQYEKISTNTKTLISEILENKKLNIEHKRVEQPLAFEESNDIIDLDEAEQIKRAFKEIK